MDFEKHLLNEMAFKVIQGGGRAVGRVSQVTAKAAGRALISLGKSGGKAVENTAKFLMTVWTETIAPNGAMLVKMVERFGFVQTTKIGTGTVGGVYKWMNKLGSKWFIFSVVTKGGKWGVEVSQRVGENGSKVLFNVPITSIRVSESLMVIKDVPKAGKNVFKTFDLSTGAFKKFSIPRPPRPDNIKPLK